MEKSSLKAATTRTIPARSTAAKVAIPARRAVSPRRAEAASFPNKDRKPAEKQYTLRPSANRSAKLPIWDIAGTPLFGCYIFSEKCVVCKWIDVGLGQFLVTYGQPLGGSMHRSLRFAQDDNFKSR